MSVRAVSALLYLPGRTRADVERALAIPALSEGWRRSFQALLERGAGRRRQPGPRAAERRPARLAGLRPFRVAEVVAESRVDRVVRARAGRRRAAAPFRPGQFLTVRVQPAGASRRCCAASRCRRRPTPRRYRISVKREPEGVGERAPARPGRGRRRDRRRRAARAVHARTGRRRAGRAAQRRRRRTPVLAMLESLAAAGQRARRCGGSTARATATSTPFADEARALRRRPARCAVARPLQPPGRADGRPRLRRRGPRRPSRSCRTLGVPRGADFYLCGPTAWMRELAAGLLGLGRRARARSTPRSSAPSRCERRRAPPTPAARRARHRPRGRVHHLGLTVRWDPAFGSLLELAEACDVPARGRAGRVSATAASRGLVDGERGLRPRPARAAGARARAALLQPARLRRGARAVSRASGSTGSPPAAAGTSRGRSSRCRSPRAS